MYSVITEQLTHFIVNQQLSLIALKNRSEFILLNHLSH